MFEKVRSVFGATTSALTALSAAVGIFAWMNIMLLCMGWLIGWQPILMTLGAFKMLNASLKIPK